MACIKQNRVRRVSGIGWAKLGTDRIRHVKTTTMGGVYGMHGQGGCIRHALSKRVRRERHALSKERHKGGGEGLSREWRS